VIYNKKEKLGNMETLRDFLIHELIHRIFAHETNLYFTR